MYFPYLYARQSELLAMRAMLDDHRSLNELVPVIEPVLANTAAVKRSIELHGKKGHRLAVVMNPDKNELQSPSALKAWRKDILPVIKANASILPAYRCRAGVSKTQVDAFLAEFAGRDVALAYSSPSLSDAEVTALAGAANVRFHIVLNGKMSTHMRALLPKAKRVDLQDRFNKLARNADYGSPEFFTDRNNTFKAEGWVGFGDYCCIGSDLTIGGGPAAAVAIHAVFKHPSSDIWIEHFVSDDTDIAVGDTASKFLQAAKKLVRAAKARPGQFGKNFALDEFEQHVKAGHFPGLGKSKELQISHHMCLMLDVLSGAV
jgi:hypothetical protein